MSSGDDTGAGGGRTDGERPDPLGELFRALFESGGAEGPDGPRLPPELAAVPGMPQDPAMLQAMLAQVQQMLAGAGDDPVNWDLARDVARQTAAAEGDPSVAESQQRQVAEALRTADLWLDRVCDLPASAARTEAWSRADWVERTLPVWKGVIEPVADSVSGALSEALRAQAPEQLRPALAGALPMVRRMGGAFFGAQVGQAIGALAGEVVSAGETGLPLLTDGATALLPGNVAAFGAGLDLPEDEVRLYLALRESAHARLFAQVPWLRGHLLGAVEEYARGIRIDTERIEQAIREIDPTDLEALQNSLASGLFEPERSPAQQAALDRLEIALALVEGWVDEVVTAAHDHLPHAAALRETVRRRRAAGGPAEHTFASLVGLDLRPRRLREAAAVWAALTEIRGVEGRDALWRHPDLVPTTDAFTDPRGFARTGHGGDTGDAMDAALAALLDAEGKAGDDRDDDQEAGGTGAAGSTEDTGDAGTAGSTGDTGTAGSTGDTDRDREAGDGPEPR
ncbi:MAG: zinc-dependent metalloprotease [Kineosporiaceae bacterium]